MCLMQFYQEYKVGALSKTQFNISKRKETSERVVIHFYPYTTYNPEDDYSFSRYAKYNLMKYKPFTNRTLDLFNGIETPS